MQDDPPRVQLSKEQCWTVVTHLEASALKTLQFLHQFDERAPPGRHLQCNSLQYSYVFANAVRLLSIVRKVMGWTRSSDRKENLYVNLAF